MPESILHEPIHALFVYGTLKRGECRERYWPHSPLRVDTAVTRGRLHDLGPYPALVEGDDLVAGELWQLRPEHVAHTLAVLDEVEDAAVGQSGLYVRRIIACESADAMSANTPSANPSVSTNIVSAYSYFYSRPGEIAHFPRVAPDADGACRWRARSPSESGTVHCDAFPSP